MHASPGSANVNQLSYRLVILAAAAAAALLCTQRACIDYYLVAGCAQDAVHIPLIVTTTEKGIRKAACLLQLFCW